MIDELIRAKPSAAKGRYIRSVTFASTMGPGVKVDPSRTRDIVEEAGSRVESRCTPSKRPSPRPPAASSA